MDMDSTNIFNINREKHPFLPQKFLAQAADMEPTEVPLNCNGLVRRISDVPVNHGCPTKAL